MTHHMEYNGGGRSKIQKLSFLYPTVSLPPAGQGGKRLNTRDGILLPADPVVQHSSAGVCVFSSSPIQ